jgi:hypothetical protein
MLMRNFTALLFLCSISGWAQGQWEPGRWTLGGVGGWATNPESTATNSLGEARVRMEPGLAVGALAAHDMYEFVSGEIRYMYRRNEFGARTPGQEFRFGGHSHLVHYDIVAHVTRRTAVVRPFLAVGGGVRIFRGTGEESASQPTDDFVVLTRTRETKPMVSAGAGVKVQVNRITFQAEFRDYISPVPNRIILPVPGTQLSGWMHDWMPLFGISVRLN